MKQIYDAIFRLYLYADTCKIIHYTTDKKHGHELADAIRGEILKFADEFAEQFFGHYGKPGKSELTVKLDVKEEDSLGMICQDVLDVMEPIRKSIKGNGSLSGMVSLIDDFKGAMAKCKFLATFDHLA